MVKILSSSPEGFPAPAGDAVFAHSCCGPCSIMTVARLRELGYAPTLFYYNPNIQPLREYLRRRDALLQVAERLDVPVILPDQDDPDLAHPRPWLSAVAALGADMTEPSRRCPVCYSLRLSCAARTAKALGFVRFSSSLLYSKYQLHAAILDAGAAAAETSGVEFLGEDFRPYWDEGQRLARDWGIYRQPYCGCLLSEYERYHKRIRPKPPLDLLSSSR